MLANRNCDFVGLGLRVEGIDGRCLLRGQQLCGRTPASVSTACVRSATTEAVDELGHELVRLLVETDLAGTGQVGRHDRDALDRLVGERRISGGHVGERHDLDLAVELLGGRGDRQGQAGRLRLDDPDLRRVIVAEQQRRNDERARPRAAVVNRTERMKPRLRPRSMISRRATSQTLRQRLIGPPPRPGDGAGVTASMNSSDSFGGW